jgi:hypothetical protein
MAKISELIPSARRLIGSLRDMGYEFAPAVADLVDNSIEAGASQVDIWIEFKGDESWVRIADNGHGMSDTLLREAMRYGSDRDYGEEDLGKFGLGMKTASMSQCQCLTVASRSKASSKPAAFCWSLEHIAKTDRWEVLEVPTTRLPRDMAEMLKNGHRTVVLWEQLDRVLGYKHPYGEAQRKQLAMMSREVEEHLAMVFHRFLSGESAKGRVRISLNGNEVNSWDPFCRKEPGTKKPAPCEIPISHDGVSGKVSFEPFILPHKDHFSSTEAHEKAAGPQRWNRQQGFYIYRADRLIQSGGWCGVRVPDEHTKLARVALSFSPKLDEAFKINVAKMRVLLPTQLRADIDKLLAPVIKAANAEYRDSLSAPLNGTASAAAKSTAGNATQSVAGRAVGPRTLFTVNEVRAKVLKVATRDERSVIRSVFLRLKRAEQHQE